jgi:formyltetrahydrofolate deformylase
VVDTPVTDPQLDKGCNLAQIEAAAHDASPRETGFENQRTFIARRCDLSDKRLSATLLLSCADRRGLVARISHFIFERGGNIIDLSEHVDSDERQFFLRIAWDMAGFSIAADDLTDAFTPLGKEFDARWMIRLNHKKHRVSIFVSKADHCLLEILWRHSLGEYNADICLVISNHETLAPLCERYSVPFHIFPVTPGNKTSQEQQELALLKSAEIDTVALARYMQVLSPQFVDNYPNGIINIHHSFLPAFAGNNPYRQAYDRGVKIIGATSHYVTKDLDEGPIIEQDISLITHRDSLEDLVRKGRDLERLVLARALRLHLEDRVLVYGRKTIVFD